MYKTVTNVHQIRELTTAVAQNISDVEGRCPCRSKLLRMPFLSKIREFTDSQGRDTQKKKLFLIPRFFTELF